MLVELCSPEAWQVDEVGVRGPLCVTAPEAKVVDARGAARGLGDAHELQQTVHGHREARQAK